MKIRELFYENEVIKWFGCPDAEVTGIAVDTRRLANSNVFVAIRGEKADGHNYITKAVENGATILVVEDIEKCGDYAANDAITIAVVENTKAALHNIVNRFWGSPAKDLKLIGVTATNGKTSTTTILEYVLRDLNMYEMQPYFYHYLLGAIYQEGMFEKYGHMVFFQSYTWVSVIIVFCVWSV